MFTTEELEQLELLTKSNPDISYFVKRFKEEEKLNLSKIYHEIKNPMTLINSTIQLIELLHPDIKNIDYWNTLNEDFNSLKNLLDDLSSYNNIDTLHKETINVYQLIDELCASFKSVTVNREVKLIFERNDYEIYLHCDKIKIKQCLLNIIKNAFEAVNDKTGTISITTEQSNELIKIIISDNGSVINSDILKDIFMPFITFKSGGTGLGLSIAQKIVKAHGGSISVKSDNNITSFTLSFPSPKYC